MSRNIQSFFVMLLARVVHGMTRLFGWMKTGLLWIAPPFLFLGRHFFRFVFVPVYSALLWLRRPLRQIASSSKSKILYVVANRYSTHAALLACVLLVSAGSVYASFTPQTGLDDGSQTLLFRMLGNDDEQLIVEDAVPTVLQPAGVSYLSGSAQRPLGGIDDDGIAFTPYRFGTTAGGSALLPSSSETGTSTAPRNKVVDYVIATGDTLGSIAADFGVSIRTILWANNLTARSTLSVGKSLRIPPYDGVLYTVHSGDTVARIASQYNADAKKILAANGMSSDRSLRIGSEIVIPDGEPPVKVAIKVPRPIAPITAIFNPNPKPSNASPDVSTKLLWPTTGHRITQYFGGWEHVQGWRIHTGVDLDGDYSSPIYAADDGVIIFAGWRTGYGLSVDIDHGNGMITRYGHSSKLFVQAGESVSRGQTIAMVGTTGYSTGTHLHFEVRIGGRPVNPLPYIR